MDIFELEDRLMVFIDGRVYEPEKVPVTFAHLEKIAGSDIMIEDREYAWEDEGAA